MGLIFINFIFLNINSLDTGPDSRPGCIAGGFRAQAWSKVTQGTDVVTKKALAHPRTTATAAAITTGVAAHCISRRACAPDDRSAVVTAVIIGFAAVAGVATWATCDHYAHRRYQAETEKLKATNNQAHAAVTARIAIVNEQAAVLDAKLANLLPIVERLEASNFAIDRHQRAGQKYLDQLGESIDAAKLQREKLKIETARADRIRQKIGACISEIAVLKKIERVRARDITVAEMVVGYRFNFSNI